MSFGNFLIKQVAEELGRGFRGLKTFATLSPVPGFPVGCGATAPPSRDTIHHAATLIEQIKRGDPLDFAAIGVNRAGNQPLGALLPSSREAGQEPLDPVARFHLANGARLQRLNWMGDMSPRGLAQSLGLMVNYVYRLADVERNHEAYAKNYQVVASRAFHRLASEASADDDDHRTHAARNA